MFPNLVFSPSGLPIAGFISSIDARSYADVECSFYSQLTVEDFAGCVTLHIAGDTNGAPAVRSIQHLPTDDCIDVETHAAFVLISDPYTLSPG